MNSRMKVWRVIVLIGVLAVVSCTVLPWVKDVNNIQDWISLPGTGTEYEYEIVTTSGGNTATDYLTYTVKGIEEKSDRVVIEVREEWNGNYDYDYLIIEKDEGVIAMSNNEYYDKYDDDIILSIPVEVGNDWLVDDNEKLYEITAIGETKEVKAGSYSDCIVVERYQNDVSEKYYYSPSAGMIVYSSYTISTEYYNYRQIMELRSLTR
ncbi:MAG: hypothetical protein R6U31_07955 [bacterium]